MMIKVLPGDWGGNGASSQRTSGYLQQATMPRWLQTRPSRNKGDKCGLLNLSLKMAEKAIGLSAEKI